MTGPVTSSIALTAPPRAATGRARGGARPFSTTTIASSTTMPIASTRPNSDRLLRLKPSPSHDGERADDGDRHGDQRDERRPPGLQEDQHDDGHEDDRVAQRLEDLVDRLVDERRRVVDDRVVDVGREAALQLVHPRANRVGRVEGVGAGQLEDAPGRRTAGRRGVQDVSSVLAPSWMPPNLTPDSSLRTSVTRSRSRVDLAVGAGLDDDVAELAPASVEPAQRAERVLERLARRAPAAGRAAPAATCTFCSRMAVDDVAGRQVAATPACPGRARPACCSRAGRGSVTSPTPVELGELVARR